MLAAAAFVALPSVALPGGAARAQTINNETWIGQVGNTNEITIQQEGRGNIAGADNVTHRLTQDGDYNSIFIDQYGWSNSIASTDLEAGRPVGLTQRGDLNEFTLTQHNSEPDGSGFNFVGAVYQESPRGLNSMPNFLQIEQSETGGTNSAAGHVVRSVRQINTTADSAPNTGYVNQSGGGSGVGNSVDELSQEGAGNLFEIIQSGQDNAVNLGQQNGSGNEFHVEQSDGETNVVDILQQLGELNRTRVHESGSRNYITRIYQNNEQVAIAGNRVKISITGEDNGGDGFGGLGQFTSSAALGLVGVAQGEITQMGDDNDVGLTITQGEGNQFGATQIGDGNGAIIAVSAQPGQVASGNEAAVYQNGFDNDYSHTVLGNDNVGAGSQVGSRNTVDLQQTGDGNISVAMTTGDDNNAASLGGFSGRADGAAATIALSPGDAFQPGALVQRGNLNTADLSITGSQNRFGLWQDGDTNATMVVVAGSTNQIAVVQTGATNTSLSSQSGSGNTLGVRQY